MHPHPCPGNHLSRRWQKKEKEAAAQAKAQAEARAKEDAAEAERKRRFQETQNAFGPVKPQKTRSNDGVTPPSTPPPCDGAAATDPVASQSPPIVVGAASPESPGEFAERETVAQESPEFSFHRDIISEDELREDLMRRKRFHDAQAAAMEARSSLVAEKEAGLKAGSGADGAAAGGPGTPNDETPEEKERRLRFQEAQKLAVKTMAGVEEARKSEEKPATGAVKVRAGEGVRVCSRRCGSSGGRQKRAHTSRPALLFLAQTADGLVLLRSCRRTRRSARGASRRTRRRLVAVAMTHAVSAAARSLPRRPLRLPQRQRRKRARRHAMWV